MPQSELIDINGLEKDLEAAIEGEIRFGTGDRAMCASDAGNYRMVPIGVILPQKRGGCCPGIAGLSQLWRTCRRARRRNGHPWANGQYRSRLRLQQVHESDS